MKSFGVRLGAGLVTIVFGAYAAALAQKDKENSSTSWAAPAPSLGEPAEPIADMGDASWLSDPAGESNSPPPSSAANMLAGAAMAFGSPQDDSVALVQHTEPVRDNAAPGDSPFAIPMDSSPPASLGTPQPMSDGGPPADTEIQIPAGGASDWMMPSDDSAPANPPTASSPTLSMSMPAPPPSNEASGGFQTPAESFDAPTFQPQPFGAQSEPAAQADIPDAAPGAAPSMNMMGVPGAEPFAPPLGGQPGNPAPAPPEPASDMPDARLPSQNAQTQNAPMQFNGLRGAPEASNGLRDSPDANSYDANSYDAQGYQDNGYAGDPTPNPMVAPEQAQPQGFAGAAYPNQNFQPEQPPVMASEALPTFAPEGYGQNEPYGPSGMNAMPNNQMPTNQMPPARTASLPSSYDARPAAYQPQPMSAPAAAVEMDPNSVFDSPGDRRLEGAQSPSIVIHKRAPAEVKVGKPASFVIQVQNVGAAEALDVRVHDRVPAGMRLVDASPAPVQQGGMLLWSLGAMPAGDERTVTMQLVPETEGELGSVARVTFEAAASVRTIATRPELKIVQRSVEKVLIGQQLEIELEVSNPGSGAATGVSLQENVPDGLEHPKGRELDNFLGTLAPGEVRNQILRLKAVQPGMVRNTIHLVSEDGVKAEHSIDVEVVAPALAVNLNGPSRRFLERQATYQLEISNQGTYEATNVQIAVQLDRGFTFVSTEYEGQYDPSRHAVFWELASLPAGVNATVPLTLLPVEEGNRALVIDARADHGTTAKHERSVSVEGFAELTFQILNPGGPIELGAESTYEISVTNGGSKPDSNVRVQLQLPSGLELVNADGDAGTNGRGLVAFQPRTALQPGESMKYRVRVRGVAPGTHIVQAMVVSDQAGTPVTKEESTLVYADQ